MAYIIQKIQTGNDIVINGFDKGIADSPELGLASIQGANITSIPGEISTSFSTVPATTPTAASGLSFSAVAATDVITVSSVVGYYPGMAVTITTAPLAQITSLLVAGGGAGDAGSPNPNNASGGGGGAGGVLSTSNQPITIGSYPVVIGLGGASTGASGQNSTFNGLTAIGGGNGGGNGGTASTGGSGGGGGNVNGVGRAGTAGQGNAGGNAGGINGNNGGGGGGGAGAVGGAGTTALGGNGGAGVANSITGSSVTYGGGGGGGSFDSPTSNPGAGGTGGGGSGSSTGVGVAGTANTGGGGGGGSTSTTGGSGGLGGSGVVIISYPTGSITATGGSITTSGGNNIHTFTSGGTFTVTGINPQPGSTYYVGAITGNTFKLYKDVGLTIVEDIVVDISGIYAVPGMTTSVWSTYYQYYASAIAIPILMTFFIDDTGNCWYLTTVASTGVGGTVAANTLQYAGNTGHETSGTNKDFGIFAYHGYLFAIIGRSIDYVSMASLVGTSGPSWTYAWKTDLTYTQYQHQSLASATYDAVFICNASYLATLKRSPAAIASNTAFDPTSSGTYNYSATSLLLYDYDYAQCVSQLGNSGILIGGILTYVYPWDGVSTSFSPPLICSDPGIYRIISTNSNSYVFAGTRGRIYITNGQQLQLYKKIPDSLTGAPDPYFIWQDALYLRNKLYFTMTATDNAGNIISTMGGLWCLGIDGGQTVIQLPTAGSLFNSNQLSYGTYGGSAPVLFYSQLNSPPGYGIGACWVNSGTFGIDTSSTIPYTNYQTSFQTDIIPIGTYFNPATDKQIEYKLSKPLVAGEKVRISWRGNLTDAFVQVWESTTTGQLSDYSTVNFQKQQWAQFLVELSSTATTPSYIRMSELRLR